MYIYASISTGTPVLKIVKIPGPERQAGITFANAMLTGVKYIRSYVPDGNSGDVHDGYQPRCPQVRLLYTRDLQCMPMYFNLHRCVMMAIVHDLAEAQGWHDEEREPICSNLPRSRRHCTAGGYIKGREKAIGRSMYDSNLFYHRPFSSPTGSNA